jgi:subtilisin family serine protease
MLRILTRLAALAGVVLCAIPILTAESPATSTPSRVIAIVRLRTSAALTAGEASVTLGETAVDAGERDRQRARRDARLVARLDAATRPGRDRVAEDIRTRGGRVVYTLPSMNAVVAELSREEVARLAQRADVASVTIDEPRQAHIDVTSQALLLPAFWNAGYTGGATDVAVIDTGLFTGHEAFQSRAASVVGEVFHETAQLMSNYWDVPTDTDDYAGHGTFVAGVVFSQLQSASPARLGTAYGIDKLFNIKAGYLTYPQGGSSLLSDLMAGVDWALLSADPPEVFNYSYGARVSSDDDLYTRFWDGVVDTFGKTATISAGNSGANTVGSPGMAYNVLCVANVNTLGTIPRNDDTIAASSSGGPTPGGRKKPDLAAPGSNLLMPSTFGPSLWSRATGTSFSAPAVAGIAALLIDAGVGDPRAVKAVLINSADPVGGSDGWHPRFGWGYVNGERAFAERQALALLSVTGPSGAAPVRYFERASPTASKATAVWHRHVSYATGGMPSSGTLNNVDLRLYSRETGELRATSESTIDNVEQVVSPLVEGAVLTVQGSTPFGETAETVALAHSAGFVARTGPDLALTLSALGTVPPASTMTVTAAVRNAGDARGHGYEVTLSLPVGFTLEQGTLTRSLGSLDANAEAVASWTVRVPASAQTSGTLSATARAEAYGSTWESSATRTVTTDTGCGFNVSPTAVSLPAAGGPAAITIEAPGGCAWTVTSSPGWLNITPTSGSGPGLVTATAAANAGYARTATLVVAGTPVSTSQAGMLSRTYYLAEGSTKSIFTLDVAVANPHPLAVDAKVTFLRPAASPIVQIHRLSARSRLTLHVDQIPGLESTDVSTVVESLGGLPLAVERTMTWDGGAYGAHGGTAVEAPSTAWYFAEGSQGFFDTYLLLANPGAVAATVAVHYLREDAPPVIRTYTVDPMSRTTIYAGDDLELMNHAFSMVVASDQAIIAERAMYWSRPGLFWAGGHESAGVPEPATFWLLAEGATGPFFDEYVLVGNPNETATEVTVRYLLAGGDVIERVKSIPAHARLTITVEAEDPRLADAAVSTTVTAAAPVIVERAMYWPGTAASWQEAHNAFGLTATATSWALAEGRVGQAAGYETYVLLANPSPVPATVRVTFLREQGAPVEKTLTVAATSRANVAVIPQGQASDAPELVDERFGVLVEVLNGVGIAVERALYWDSGGTAWASGTSAAGVKIQ